MIPSRLRNDPNRRRIVESRRRTDEEAADEPQHPPSAEENTAEQAPATPPRPFAPEVEEVYHVRYLLTKHLGLPTELANLVLEAAEYYPAMISQRLEPLSLLAKCGQAHSAATMCLLSGPVLDGTPEEPVRVKSVRFWIKSHDQGWGGPPGCAGKYQSLEEEGQPFAYTASVGTYNGSYTWFVACIFRPLREDAGTPDFSPPVVEEPLAFSDNLKEQGWEFVQHEGTSFWDIQRNITANRQAKEHEVVWKSGEDHEPVDGSGDGKGFITALKPGDRIGVWARALYPGWVNHLEQIQLDIRYAV